jgi:hypothetical protein
MQHQRRSLQAQRQLVQFHAPIRLPTTDPYALKCTLLYYNSRLCQELFGLHDHRSGCLANPRQFDISATGLAHSRQIGYAKNLTSCLASMDSANSGVETAALLASSISYPASRIPIHAVRRFIQQTSHTTTWEVVFELIGLVFLVFAPRHAQTAPNYSCHEFRPDFFAADVGSQSL